MPFAWRRGARWPAWLGLTVYAVILVVSPVLHHDLACHVKSPTHCDACAANPLASSVETAVLAAVPALAVAGEVAPPATAPSRTPSLAAASGRAPPA